MANINKTKISDSSQSYIIRLIRYLLILATIGISFVFFYLFFTQTMPVNYNIINTWYSPIVATIALIAIFLRAISSPKGANSRKAYFGITLAVFFYFLGEITWSIQYVLLGSAQSIPYPSISDFFWGIGTVFFIDELFFMVSVIRVKFSKKQLTAIYGITALSVVSLLILAFNQVIFAPYTIATATTSAYTPFMKAMDLYYFIGDILILFATLYVTFGLFSKTGLRISLKHLAFIFLILGNIGMIFGDTFYYFFTYSGADISFQLGSFYRFVFINFSSATYDYSIYNLFYVFQYMFWALSFIFLPTYLMRSFSEEETAEEFIPVEPEKTSTVEIPGIAENISGAKIFVANSLSLMSDTVKPASSQTESIENQAQDLKSLSQNSQPQPTGDQNQNSRSE